MISRIKWDALKKQSPAVTDQPQAFFILKKHKRLHETYTTFSYNETTNV